MKLRFNMRQEVFFISLILFLVMIIIITGLITSAVYNTNYDRAINHLKSINYQNERSINRYFSEQGQQIALLSQDQDILQASDDSKIQERVKEKLLVFENYHSNLNDAYVGYENGLMLINDWDLPKDYDPRERPWYQVAIESTPEVTIAFPFMDAQSDVWLISQSIALYNQGDFVGVLSIDAELDTINTLIIDNISYNHQQTFILTSDGQFLIHPSSDLLLTYYENFKTSIQTSSGIINETYNQEKVIGFYHKIEDMDLYIVTTTHLEDITRPMMKRLYLYVGIGFIFSAIVGIILVVIFDKRFVKALSMLSQNIESITKGKASISLDKKLYNYEIIEIANRIESLAERSLQKKANELTAIIESTSDGILVADNDFNVLYANSNFLKQLGLKEFIFTSLDDPLFLEHIKNILVDYDLTLFSEEKSNGKDILRLKNNLVYEKSISPLMENKEIVGWLWNFRDITEQYNNLETLSTQASTDELTGLFNRREFFIKANQVLKEHTDLSLLVIDIDFFKKINDQYGHLAGDYALKSMAELLTGTFRKSDLIARIGGEEFIVLLDIKKKEKVYELAEKLRVNTEDHYFMYENQMIQFTISIGIASYQNQDTIESIYKRADDACYISKDKGRNQTTLLE